jgi:hypothetical protein
MAFNSPGFKSSLSVASILSFETGRPPMRCDRITMTTVPKCPSPD